ncbi:MAG: hypothetical protein WCH99_07315 [Verrucomicrobiota bacterium]
MKSPRCRFDVFGGKQFQLFLVGLILATVLGCNKEPSAGALKGNLKATWAFWQTIQKPATQNTIIQRLDGLNAETASAQDIQLLFRKLGGSCQIFAGQITSAEVAGVDADAAAFGVMKAQLMIEWSKFFESVAVLAEKERESTSGEAWLFDYFFALARHSDEGRDAWGNALMEELVGKAKTIGNMPAEGQNLAEVMRALSGKMTQLQTMEMQTRITLAQRYGKEFPTVEAIAKQNPPPPPKILGTEKLDSLRQKIMKNLMGRKINTKADGKWTFDAMEEFKTFNVVHGTNYGDVVDFEVATHVKGVSSGAEHVFHLLLTYLWSKDGSRLMFVKPY